MSEFTFGGYATRNDLQCLDGRIIRKGAFDDCNGKVVPIVWQHDHGDPTKVLGHGVLETRPDGTYIRGSFNNTEAGKIAEELVKHRDIRCLSIYAGQLKQRANEVLHGVIHEVSLCLSGANPGAYIDDLSLEHSLGDDFDDGEAFIFNGDNIEVETLAVEEEIKEPELAHSAEEHKDEPKVAEEVKETKPDDKTIRDVVNGMSEEEKNVMYFLIAKAMEEGGSGEGESEMKHNVFENETPDTTLSHADLEKILKDAKRLGSLKEAFCENMQDGGVLAHAVFDENGNEVTYGIANLDYLFPDAKVVGEEPQFIRRKDDWVSVVMNGVHHSPFSKVKSIYANITMEEARARGYIKGTKKKDEVFSLLKRVTDATTVYKKQKMDRDDIIDLANGTRVISMLKSEMRRMLNEELARAYLFGDGRSNVDTDKIDPTRIRPIWTDDDLFTLQVHVTAGADDAATAKNAIKAIIKGFENYEGSGNPIMFIAQSWLTNMLLLEDGIGHFLYPDVSKLATTLQVSKIVPVPIMKNLTRNEHPLIALIVDLDDYNVGTNQGGEINFFDDFDIDMNQEKYLIETRCSGALTKPFSAIAVEIGGSAPSYSAVTPESGDNPKTEGWYEKQGDLYILSGDSEAKNGKTYYARS